jgi:DNA-directed RNA polymerase subunit beta'
MISFQSVKALRITLASPDQIRSWSSGEVTQAETINYRTLKPEPGGLFCERIFGPSKDWTCACGKYRRYRYKGKICEKCGVKITSSRVRRVRMGHIELAAPVSHIWYAQSQPSRIGLLLDLSARDLDSILMYTHYIVLHLDEEARQQEKQRIDAEIERLETLLADRASAHNGHTTAALLETAPKYSTVEDAQEAANQAKQSHEQSIPAMFVDMPLEDISDLPAFLNSSDLEQNFAQYSPSPNEVRPIPEEAEEVQVWQTPHEHLEQLKQVKRALSQLTLHSLLEGAQGRLLKVECDQAALRLGIGAEAIEELLTKLDLDQLALAQREKLQEQDGASRSRAIKRLKVVEALKRSGTRPEWMIMHAIPVLPPTLRPVLSLNSGRFASSDINELYTRVIHRNQRLKRLLEIDAPELTINHEKQALQIACDALFDNAHSRRPHIGAHHQTLRSLSDSLRGKTGRFRHNLLGKRVDYSGRSVISVGTTLKLHQCGLPKKIALELFKPFVIQQLLASNIIETPKAAKRAVEQHHPAVWDILDEVMRGRVVLLNRAPTLHRLSIQAFEPILVEGSAIRLHPLVCSAFNADFDGDQMAVHLPLSKEAQAEAHERMLSTHNLLSPATGEPSISISQEIVLGCYYLTQERPNKKGAGRMFADANEAITAYTLGVIDLQARITVRIDAKRIFIQPPPAPSRPSPDSRKVQTTVGRLLFNAVLPRKLRFKNYAMTKDLLKQLVWECIKTCGLDATARMADAIKTLGYHHATRAGISFAISDVEVPADKKAILADADTKIGELRSEWQMGLITREERYEQTLAIWSEATDAIARQVQSVLDPFGSVATIASSGATKAKLQQIRQLSGMRGLMASPSGAIIETPVRGNFLEGLNVAEYFLSSHGARKSLMDRSLNTASAGYLTIRFVNVAQDVIVTSEDCGTDESLLISESESQQMGLADSRNRLLGRVLAEALPQAGLAAGDELNEEAVERIYAAKISQVHIRSVLSCHSRRGICSKCYGWDLSTRSLVKVGTAVGIIAAQSIGEPGTQLTMRTFHSGGIAGGQGDITQGLPRVEELFEARAPKDPAIVSESKGTVQINKDPHTHEQTVQIIERSTVLDEYPLPVGSALLVRPHSQVQAGQVIARLSMRQATTEREVRARLSGEIFVNEQGTLVIHGEGTTTRTYRIPAGRKLVVSDGQTIQEGDPLTTGALNLQDLLRLKGCDALEHYLLQEAQRVYRTTGAYVHDKHFEILIRQMIRYVQVEDPGDSDLLPEARLDRLTCMEHNARVVAEGGQPATACIILLGLTQAVLATESWLAAASFQHTTHVLTDAVLEGKTDYLVGLKENVMLGHLIPAGTGLHPRPPAPPSRRTRPERRKRML